MKNKRSRITARSNEYMKSTNLEGRDDQKEFGLAATTWRQRASGKVTYSTLWIRMSGAEMHLTHRQMLTLKRLLDKHLEQ